MSIKSLFPNSTPSITFDFTKSKSVDPKLSYTRASTGTYFDSNGILKYASVDEPRFDHRFKFRTNLIKNSEDLEGYWYENQDMDLAVTTAVNPPEGANSVYLLTETTGIGTHSVYRNETIRQGETVTFSIYIKSAGKNLGFLYFDATGGHRVGLVYFDLGRGIIYNSDPGMS